MNLNRPIVLVDDEDLLDDVLKLAAATGCDLERVPDVAAARLRWANAPLVVLDRAGARGCRGLGLPRRGSVVLVCGEPPPAELWELAVTIGAERVVQLPDDEPKLVEMLADAVDAPAAASGRVLGVLGGRGGAGASVFAVSVGLTALHGGQSTLLIDCDPLGGGLDLVLGAETDDGLRWPDMRLRSGRVSASSLHAALPGRAKGEGRLTLLSGARQGTGPEPDAVAAVLEAGRRAGETVVCDLPRHLDAGACAALSRADLAVIVVPAEVRACVAARLVAARARDRGATRMRLVVRGPSPGRLSPEEVADAVGLPLLTSMRPEPRLAEQLDRGEFRPRPGSPLVGAAKVTLDTLAAAQHGMAARDLRSAS